MERRPVRDLLSMGWLLVLVTFFVFLPACNRSEPPPPQQTQQPYVQQPMQQQPMQQQPMQQPPMQATQDQPSMQPQGAPPVAGYPSQPAPPPSGYQQAPSYAPSPAAPGPQSFAQIRVGMSSQEVLALMGQPGRVKPEHGGLEWEWYTPQGKFEVILQNDRVVSFKSKH